MTIMAHQLFQMACGIDQTMASNHDDGFLTSSRAP